MTKTRKPKPPKEDELMLEWYGEDYGAGIDKH